MKGLRDRVLRSCADFWAGCRIISFSAERCLEIAVLGLNPPAFQEVRLQEAYKNSGLWHLKRLGLPYPASLIEGWVRVSLVMVSTGSDCS